MKNYLFLVLFLLILGCKTAQKGYFYNQQSSFISVKEKKSVEPVFASLKAIPVADLRFAMIGKINQISIEKPLLQPPLIQKYVNKKRNLATIAVVCVSTDNGNGNRTNTKILKVLKKSTSRSSSSIYIALTFVSASILAMLLFANSGPLMVTFGILTLLTALFFGIKEIRSLKNKKHNDKE